MKIVSCLEKIAQHWRAFGRAEDGNIAVIFALSLIPLLGLIGGAIDYSRASAVRAAMQTAADATALAVSKEAPGKTATQLQTDANNYFNAVFDQSDGNGIKVDAKFTKNPDQKVVIDVSGNVKSYFMRIWPFNITEIPVGVSSTTVWGNSRLRIALALDNTGSMADKKKMEKLKEATNKLIDQLAAVAANSGDVYVSVIPFSVDVNVGKDNRSANWIDWTDWEAENGSCSKSSYKSKRRCERRGGTWTPDSRSTWNGCVADRDKSNDVSNLAPDPEKKSTLFPADQYNRCPSEMIALTDLAAVTVDPEEETNVDKLKGRVGNMYPAGNTNITIGLAWAWQSLAQTAPLHAPPEDSEYVYRNIIILLTDGKNTENRFTGRTSNIDERTEKVCNDIKAVKEGEALVYRIYAIRVIDGNASLLKQCASDPDEYDDKYYYNVETADEIEEAFIDIASKLSKLRLAE